MWHAIKRLGEKPNIGRLCHLRNSIGLSFLFFLGLLVSSDSLKAQITNWDGTWNGTWDSSGIFPNGNSYSQGGYFSTTISVANGVVSGSFTSSGWLCFGAHYVTLDGNSHMTGSVSGIASGNDIDLTFSGSIVDGPCAGDALTLTVDAFLSGNTITGPISPNGQLVLTNSPTVTQTNKTLGCPCDNAGGAGVGEPISLETGNMYETAADYSTAGSNPLSFTRYYNSLSDTNTRAFTLGANWRSTYDRYLRIASSITAERENGQELLFTWTGTNWTSDSDVNVQLIQTGSLWTLIENDDSVETYNANGVLISIQARNGYTQSLQYNNGGQLLSVADSFGRALQFAYQSNLLQTVSTPNGQVLTYGYNPSRAASISYTTNFYYSTNVAGGMTNVTYATNIAYNTNITGCVATVVYITNFYGYTNVYSDTNIIGGTTNIFYITNIYENTNVYYGTNVMGGTTNVVDVTNVIDCTNIVDGLQEVAPCQTNIYAYTNITGGITNVGYTTNIYTFTNIYTDTNITGGVTNIGYITNFYYSTNITSQTNLADCTTNLVSVTNITFATNVVGGVTNLVPYFTNVVETMVPAGPPLLVSVTYSTTPQTSQFYLYTNVNLPFALTGIIDENGNLFTSWTYDSDGRALSSQFANGAELTTIGYNDIDGSRTVTNALGSVMVYRFAVLQGVPKVFEIIRMATATVPAASRTFTYDLNGYLAASTDWNTNQTSEINDYRGLVLTNNEAVGTLQARTTTNIWHPTFHLPLQSAGPRIVMAFTYDTNGNMLTRTDTDTRTGTVPYSTSGQTRIWTNTYTNFGEMLTSTGPRTDVVQTTSFTYDTNGNVSAITDALGHVITLTNYNGSGLPQTMIDQNKVITTFSYDPRDRLLTRTVQTAEGNAMTTFAYDAVGQVIQITLPDNSALKYQYDPAHRLESVSNLLGESIVYLRDAGDNITNQVIENSEGDIVKTQRRVFDSLSRLLEDIGANSQTNIYGYDADGNRISTTDGLNNTTSQAFDALNRLISTLDPMTNSIAFGFDPQDNPTSVTDPRLLTTLYDYDGFRHKLQETSPDKGTTVFMVDKAGNQTNETDARNVVTIRTFDALNRMTSETYPASPGENISCTYDSTAGGNFGIGRLTGFTDETGSTSLFYNERGDVMSTTRTIGGVPYTTAYGYDLADHVISITYPSGDEFTYTRDSQGRISSVSYSPSSSGAGPVLATNVTYMPFGPVSGLQYGNGLTRVQIYDEDYRLTNVLTEAANNPVQNLVLGYDTVNDIVSFTDNLAPTRNQIFQYDPDYRLTNAEGLYSTIGYTYDGDGNRLTQTAGGITQVYNYPATANMLESVVGGGITRNFTYTLNGNVATDNRGTSTNLVFNYGNRNRYNDLVSSANTIATYHYNALGERLAKTVGTNITHYHYDLNHHLIAESTANGALIREYIWLDDMPLAQIEASGAVYYIHPDHLNTPQKMTDVNQNIVWDREQQPFGETTALTYPALTPTLAAAGHNQGQFQLTVGGLANFDFTLQASTNLSGNWESLITAAPPFTFTDLEANRFPARFYRAVSTSPAVTQNLRFPGQNFDAVSGLNYNMMRDYDPTLGRYIQGDPVGLAGGISLYVYAGNAPIHATDTHGLQFVTFFGQVPPEFEDIELPPELPQLPPPVEVPPGSPVSPYPTPMPPPEPFGPGIEKELPPMNPPGVLPPTPTPQNSDPNSPNSKCSRIIG